MKNTLLAVATLVIVIANAAPAAAAATSSAAAKPDPMLFCYVAGQSYSEGAEYDGKVCTRPTTADAFERKNLPLRWEIAGEQKVRTISSSGVDQPKR